MMKFPNNDPQTPRLPNSNSGFVNKNYFSTPAVNITDDKFSFQIHLAAPGLKQQDFQLRLVNHILTISGIRKENNSQGYLRREFGFSNFEKSFQLPITSDLNRIKANYCDGILYINIPKAPHKRLLHFSRN